jgi:hypothetical protein
MPASLPATNDCDNQVQPRRPVCGPAATAINKSRSELAGLNETNFTVAEFPRFVPLLGPLLGASAIVTGIPFDCLSVSDLPVGING